VEIDWFSPFEIDFSSIVMQIFGAIKLRAISKWHHTMKLGYVSVYDYDTDKLR